MLSTIASANYDAVFFVAILSFAGDRSDRGFVMRGVLFGLLAVCVSGCVTIEDVARRDTRVGIAAMAGRFGEALQEKGRAAAVADVLTFVTDGMKDPESVRFRKVRVVQYEAGAVVCGEINAKNGYGGYTGFSPFVAAPSRAVIRRDSHDAVVMGMNWAIFDVCELGDELPETGR